MSIEKIKYRMELQQVISKLSNKQLVEEFDNSTDSLENPYFKKEILKRLENKKNESNKLRDGEFEPWYDEDAKMFITHLPRPNAGQTVTKGG